MLSPILFAIFINGLAKEIKESHLGVSVHDNFELSILLYADDIVLISDSREILQSMLDIVSTYATKWRFELNKKKSQVVIFGASYPHSTKWRLAGGFIDTVNSYKYLGIELTRKLNWGPYIKRISDKAKRNMVKAWAMGISAGVMSVELGDTVWKALVRSVLDYGSEFWGEKNLEHLEKIQLDMGKRLLRCGERMSGEVVRGELGWWRLKARRDESRLRYWRIMEFLNYR